MVTKITQPAEVSLPSDTDVRVTRDFKAPRRLVWQAHVDPKLFQRWIGGYPGWSMPVCEMDVRTGGKYRWRWRTDDGGQEFGFFGEYVEVEAPVRMIATEYYDPGTMGGAMDANSPTINHTSFTENNGVTTLVTLLKYVSKEARDAAISTGMTDGMEVSYARLEKLVAEQQGG